MDIQKTLFLSIQAWAQVRDVPIERDALYDAYMEYIEKRQQSGKLKNKHIVEIAVNYPHEVLWVCEDPSLHKAIERGRKNGTGYNKTTKIDRKIVKAIKYLQANGYTVTNKATGEIHE